MNQDLIERMESLLSSRQEYEGILGDFASSYESAAPYLFIYHSRNSLGKSQNSLTLSVRAQQSLLSGFTTEEYAEDYTAAGSLLSQGRMSPRNVRYLFKPGDVLISRVDGRYIGYISTSWPMISWNKKVSRMQASTSGNAFELPLYGSQAAEAK